jgi:2-oxoisovalerate dehydrogenase E1 component
MGVHWAVEVQNETGIDIEIIDLRTLVPLDVDTILSSVKKTGKVLVVHEATETSGFGAELVARLTEKHFSSLKAAPLRIASLDLPVPFAPELEQAFRPTKDKIIERITEWMG